MVFAPAPQLTITIEKRGDRPDIHLHAGGQGVWQARMITVLGVPVSLCTALGGECGRVLSALLPGEGVGLHAVYCDSRNGAYVHDRRGGTRVPIAQAAGDPLSRHELDELYGLTLTEGLEAGVCLLAGPAEEPVVPPDMYRRLAKDLTRNGATVLADLAGDYLSAVLAGGVRFVKVSHEELIADGRADGDSTEELVKALYDLRDAGAKAIVVSRAHRPALALLDDDIVYEVTIPELEPADPRGAGDSMIAGVAAALARNESIASAVRAGAAAGALNVTRHGLGTGRAEGITRLATRVRLAPVDTSHKGGRLATPHDLAARARPR